MIAVILSYSMKAVARHIGAATVVASGLATPETVQKLASELHLPVDEDLERAMREGKESEQRVREKYRSEG